LARDNVDEPLMPGGPCVDAAFQVWTVKRQRFCPRKDLTQRDSPINVTPGQVRYRRSEGSGSMIRERDLSPAARFRRKGDERAFSALLEIINRPDSRRFMEAAEERFDRPALTGIVGDIVHHPQIRPILAGKGTASLPFRQLTGIAVLVAMQRWGWRKKPGNKGKVGPSAEGFFTVSQRYERVPTSRSSHH
jgi:hypothetical protein